MKKFILPISLILILIILVFLGYKLFYAGKRVEDLTTIVPDKYSVYIYFSNFGEGVNNLINSPVYNKIKDLYFYKKYILPRIGEIFKDKNEIFKLLNGDLLLAFNFYKEDGLLLIRLHNVRDFKKRFEKLPKKFKDITTEETSKYKGFLLRNHRILGKEKEIVSTFVGNVFLATTEESSLKKAIDLFLRRRKDSLREREGYKYLKSKVSFDGVIGWLYWDMENYRKVVLSYLASDIVREGGFSIEGSMVIKNVREYLDRWGGYSLDTLTYEPEDNLLVLNILWWNKGKEEGKAKNTNNVQKYFANSVDKKILRILPYASLYFYSLSIDPLYFKEIIDATKDLQGWEKEDIKLGGFHKKLINFLRNNKEDIFSLLGHNYGVVLADIEEIDATTLTTTGIKMPVVFPLPLPAMFLYGEAKNIDKFTQKVDALLGELISQINKKIPQGSMKKFPSQNPEENKKVLTPPTVRIESTMYKDRLIKMINIDKAPFLNLNYFTLDNYFIFSTSFKETQKLINRYLKEKDTSSLWEYLNSQRIKDYLSKDYNNLFLFNIEMLTDKIKNMKLYNILRVNLPLFFPQSKDILEIVDSTLELGAIFPRIWGYNFLEKEEEDIMAGRVYIKLLSNKNGE